MYIPYKHNYVLPNRLYVLIGSASIESCLQVNQPRDRPSIDSAMSIVVSALCQVIERPSRTQDLRLLEIKMHKRKIESLCGELNHFGTASSRSSNSSHLKQSCLD
jgi:hypothetical protein